MVPDTQREKTDKRHVAGFKRFQNAAIRALGAALEPLRNRSGEAGDDTAPVVRLSDMKSLVSAYKDAVIGERMVLGMDGRTQGRTSGEWPDEMVIRWVEDNSREPDAEENDA